MKPRNGWNAGWPSFSKKKAAERVAAVEEAASAKRVPVLGSSPLRRNEGKFSKRRTANASEYAMRSAMLTASAAISPFAPYGPTQATLRAM